MRSSYRKQKRRHAYRHRLRAWRRNHGRSGEADLRGNYRDRRARKLWMLRTFGTGKTTHCAHCGKKLTYATVTADRIIPGCQGGRYTHGNIQPACDFCNKSRNFQQCSIAKEDDPREAMLAAIRRNGFSRYRWKKMKRRAAA